VSQEESASGATLLETNHRFPTFAPISNPSAQNLSPFQPNY